MSKLISILVIAFALTGLITPVIAQGVETSEQGLQSRVEELGETGYQVFFMETLEVGPGGKLVYTFELEPAVFYFEIMEPALRELGLTLGIYDGNRNTLYDSVDDPMFQSSGTCMLNLEQGTQITIEVQVGEVPPHQPMSLICAKAPDGEMIEATPIPLPQPTEGETIEATPIPLPHPAEGGTVEATPIPLPHPSDGGTIEATPIPLPYPAGDETISATPITLPKPVPPMGSMVETMPIPIPYPVPEDLISSLPLPIPMPVPELSSEMQIIDYFTRRSGEYVDILSQHGYEIACSMVGYYYPGDNINGFDIEAGNYILLAETLPSPGETGLILITKNGDLINEGSPVGNLSVSGISMPDRGIFGYEMDSPALTEGIMQPLYLLIIARIADASNP